MRFRRVNVRGKLHEDVKCEKYYTLLKVLCNKLHNQSSIDCNLLQWFFYGDPFWGDGFNF